jgi:hypothetical protein
MRLACGVPSNNAVFHFGEVCVAGFCRPPGGFIGSHSMQVGAIEDQLGMFVGG